MWMTDKDDWNYGTFFPFLLKALNSYNKKKQNLKLLSFCPCRLKKTRSVLQLRVRVNMFNNWICMYFLLLIDYMLWYQETLFWKVSQENLKVLSERFLAFSILFCTDGNPEIRSFMALEWTRKNPKPC